MAFFANLQLAISGSLLDFFSLLDIRIKNKKLTKF